VEKEKIGWKVVGGIHLVQDEDSRRDLVKLSAAERLIIP